jgi:hypothetical protein
MPKFVTEMTSPSDLEGMKKAAAIPTHHSSSLVREATAADGGTGCRTRGRVSSSTDGWGRSRPVIIAGSRGRL